MRVQWVTDNQAKFLDIPDGQTVQDVIDAHDVNDETFFVQVNGNLVHPKTVLKEGDELRFVGIIYGG
ncbi:MoaD/ThiS family protein [Candidatus Micrarchaeota archaeon]|nr:MoaD/ThiS family protein [Candidatus Micrarchaeota archaeon]